MSSLLTVYSLAATLSAMAKPIPIDITAPVQGILDATGLTAYGLAKRAEQTPQSVAGHVRRAGGIGLDTLAGLARAAGYEVEVRLKKIDTGE
jgi:hypothetical protein